MSKTDGIGTWVWNSELTQPNIDAVYSITFQGRTNDVPPLPTASTSTIIVNNKEVIVNQLDIYPKGETNAICSLFIEYNEEILGAVETLVYATTDGFPDISQNGWYNVDDLFDDPVGAVTYDVKSINITYIDTDASALDVVLPWLTANATYQEPVSDKYKLLDQNGNLLEINGMSKGIVVYGGKEYEFDNGGEATDELLGTWYFNETITIPDILNPDDDYSNTANIIFDFVGEDGQDVGNSIGRYYFTPDGINTLEYVRPTIDYMPQPPIVSYESGTWVDQKYRTITITDTSALTNRDEFTTWLKANAVKQGGGG